MSATERIKKKARRQPVSKPSQPTQVADSYSKNSTWNHDELMGERNEENPSAINENTQYPSEAEGLIANPSEGGLTFVPILPAKSTINTTSLPQTIIKSLDPESVRVFENAIRALGRF